MRALIPLILFGLLVIGFAIGLSRDPSVLPSEMLDRPVPEFSLPSLYADKPDITQDIFTGQISVLNFFGSWCVACVQEHPKLVEVGASNTLQLIGVDWRDSVAAGQGWLTRYGNPYDAVIFDAGSLLAIDLGITGAPESFLINRRGRIVFKHVGIITDAVWAEDFLPRIAILNEAE